ncbi:MAG TPA: C39 family peptidase, partial [Tepidisphaeraceae bacterium]
NPSLRRLAVCYSGVVGDARRREDLVTPVAFEHLPSARDIPVPFRAQGSAAKPLRPEICSPTSVSMVLQYLGFDRPTEENALGIYDAEYDLFGNWSRAVAWAGQNGFDGWLTRFRNWDQVRATLASGQPIIASIRFKKGQCPSFVMSETAGHLIVIRGFTSGGDFIVNDPASKDKGNGAVYKAADLSKAWLDHGGVGYILRKPHT